MPSVLMHFFLIMLLCPSEEREYLFDGELMLNTVFFFYPPILGDYFPNIDILILYIISRKNVNKR